MKVRGHVNMNQIHKKRTMDAKFEGSSQPANGDSINRRNGQGPQHLKFFLLVFLTLRPKQKINKSKDTSISR